ncbi:MAG: nicotinate (nicotinamide) nucleotide adenylyltransferase [Bacteroidota bacterium]
MKIGLFFGSFNPIHVGHLIIANVMIETTDIEKTWFVVSPQNPFKKSKSLLHEFDRLDMVNAAIHDNYNLKACDIEFNMPRPSYTVDTLTYLSDKYPQHQFHLIIGQDNLVHFHKWKNYKALLENYKLYVYPRPDSSHTELEDHPNVRMVEAPMIDISATFIRKCLKNEMSVKYLIPDSVLEIIEGKKFYI